MRITFVTRKVGNVERGSHCGVLHIAPVRVARLFLDCNGVFAIKAYIVYSVFFSKDFVLLLLLLLFNFITDSLLHTCASKYDSYPNYKHYNKDTTLVFSYYTTRHEHKAAPSSGNVLLKSIQCWRRVTLSQWYV